MNSCPDCNTWTLYKRLTLKGILYGIFCFPCGLYCCLQRRETYCSSCHCEVVATQPTGISSMGYNFRNYKATTNGVPLAKSRCYRNAALSVLTTETNTTASSEICSSQSELVKTD